MVTFVQQEYCKNLSKDPKHYVKFNLGP